jgi:hypothetical protein
MKTAGWMIVAAGAPGLFAAAVAGRAAEILLGMAAPLAAATVSWVLIERIYARQPERLTGLMIGAFGAKMLFFGAYVAVMLQVMALDPKPFVVSFTSYFIALYLVEALLMRRLFGAEGRARR